MARQSTSTGKIDKDKFNKVNRQLSALHQEVSILSKRKPDDAINKFKLKFINQVLVEVNAVLNRKNKPFQDFATFQEDEMPTNSDVVMILAQYLECFDRQGRDRSSFINV